MKSALVNAGMFRAINLAASTEETRYYLNGVYMEPHPSGRGVLITATDGHRLVSAYDEAGSISEPGILALPAALLKECKSKRDLRLLQVVDGVPSILSVKRTAAEKDGYSATLDHPETRRLAVAPIQCLVDGTFPDWRRVVPKPFATCTPKPTAYNPILLATFADVVAALMDAEGIVSRRDQSRAMSVANGDADGPALVRWAGTPNAFAVIMPMRAEGASFVELPAYMAPVAASVAEQEKAAA